MAIVEVTVRAGTESRDLQLRDDLASGRLAHSVAVQMGKPAARANGRAIDYALRRSDSLSPIPAGETLAQAEVRSGATLILVDPEIEASSEAAFLLDRARDAATRHRAGGPGAAQFHDAALVFYRDYLKVRPDDMVAGGEYQALGPPLPPVAAAAPRPPSSGPARAILVTGAAGLVIAGLVIFGLVIWLIVRHPAPCEPSGRNPGGWSVYKDGSVGVALYYPPSWDMQEPPGTLQLTLTDRRSGAYIRIASGKAAPKEDLQGLLGRTATDLATQCQDLRWVGAQVQREYGGVMFLTATATYASGAGSPEGPPEGLRSVVVAVGMKGTSSYALRIDAPADEASEFNARFASVVTASLTFCDNHGSSLKR